MTKMLTRPATREDGGLARTRTCTSEEQAQYDVWNPSDQQVESEWAQLMSNVPPKGKEEVPDFDRSPYEVRKRMVWEVRKVLTAHDHRA